MADRSICPLSTYYAGCGTTRKNRFCDTHPLHRILILFNIMVLIGQMSTKTIHAPYAWGLTPYSCFTHSPMSWGLTIHSNNRANKHIPGHTIFMGFNVFVCCDQGLVKLISHVPHIYQMLEIPNRMQYISCI